MISAPAVSPAGVFVSVVLAPPVLPVYVQPPCPIDGYLWTPGYWAYGNAGYYWVPGVWVAPPAVGLLWTPPYWGFAGGVYGFHAGYWGPHVGFYGGINYGFGYGGVGFAGGVWQGGRFAYNTAVVHVNTTVIHNTYSRTVVVNNINNRTSFNGPGGITVRPSPQEISAQREQHVQPTANQLSHERAAGADRNQFASVNHGRPATMAPERSTAAGGRPAAMNRPENVARPPAESNRQAEQRQVAGARPAQAARAHESHDGHEK